MMAGMSRSIRQLFEDLGAMSLGDARFSLDATGLGLTSVFGGALTGETTLQLHGEQACQFEAPAELSAMGPLWVAQLQRVGELRSAIRDGHRRLATRLFADVDAMTAAGLHAVLEDPRPAARARLDVRGRACVLERVPSGNVRLVSVDQQDVPAGIDAELALEDFEDAASAESALDEVVAELEMSGTLVAFAPQPTAASLATGSSAPSLYSAAARPPSALPAPSSPVLEPASLEPVALDIDPLDDEDDDDATMVGVMAPGVLAGHGPDAAPAAMAPASLPDAADVWSDDSAEAHTVAAFAPEGLRMASEADSLAMPSIALLSIESGESAEASETDMRLPSQDTPVRPDIAGPGALASAFDEPSLDVSLASSLSDDAVEAPSAEAPVEAASSLSDEAALEAAFSAANGDASANDASADDASADDEGDGVEDDLDAAIAASLAADLAAADDEGDALGDDALEAAMAAELAGLVSLEASAEGDADDLDALVMAGLDDMLSAEASTPDAPPVDAEDEASAAMVSDMPSAEMPSAEHAADLSLSADGAAAAALDALGADDAGDLSLPEGETRALDLDMVREEGPAVELADIGLDQDDESTAAAGPWAARSMAETPPPAQAPLLSEDSSEAAADPAGWLASGGDQLSGPVADAPAGEPSTPADAPPESGSPFARLAGLVGEGLSTGKTGAIELDAAQFAYLRGDAESPEAARAQRIAALESEADALESRARALRNEIATLRAEAGETPAARLSRAPTPRRAADRRAGQGGSIQISDDLLSASAPSPAAVGDDVFASSESTSGTDAFDLDAGAFGALAQAAALDDAGELDVDFEADGFEIEPQPTRAMPSLSNLMGTAQAAEPVHDDVPAPAVHSAIADEATRVADLGSLALSLRDEPLPAQHAPKRPPLPPRHALRVGLVVSQERARKRLGKVLAKTVGTVDLGADLLDVADLNLDVVLWVRPPRGPGAALAAAALLEQSVRPRMAVLGQDDTLATHAAVDVFLPLAGSAKAVGAQMVEALDALV